MFRALLGLSILAGCSQHSPAPPPGARIYSMACARCHGPNGAGDGPRAAQLGTVPSLRTALDIKAIRSVVTKGRGEMPAHADRLSSADIEAVSQYVAGLFP